jgi:predicted membrane-bound spermidine synthase
VNEGREFQAPSKGLEAKPELGFERSARPWRLVFGTSLIAGVVQIALIRELSAYHALSSVDLSIRLVIAVVIAAYGIGAVLCPLIGRFGEPRALTTLGAGLALYLIALLVAGLWWLESQLSASAVDAFHLLALGALVAPPFVACGMVVAHLVTNLQRHSPDRIGAFVGLSLVGTMAGVILSYHYAQWIGINSLMVLAALCALPVLLDRPILACVVAVIVTALPVEGWLEDQRDARPDFFGPVNIENTELVFSGWSPHQKVDLYTFEDEILLGCYNGFWQWWVAAHTDHPNAFPGYSLLYAADRIEKRDVLVIGSGAGMGLLHLEASHPRSITAVELDPLVVELSRGPFAAFNDRIYDRVEVFAMDGRSFLEATDQSFDVIIYEASFLTATHPKVAVSVESYLYTREGIEAALQHLRPGGLGIVTYAGSNRAFARVIAGIERQGASVATLRVIADETLWPQMPALIFGRDAQQVDRVLEQIFATKTSARVGPYLSNTAGAEPITDARPFLYAGRPGELQPLGWMIAACLAALLIGLRRPKQRAVRSYYFLIGAAFMLVQYGIVSAFRSFLGDPVTTAYAVVLFLLGGMALGSTRLPVFLAWSRPRQCVFAAAALLISAAAIWWLPLDLAFAPIGIRSLLAAIAVVPIAVLLGIFFPLGLRGQSHEAVATAYLYDALGTIAGFMLFYLVALQAGTTAPFAFGAVAYAAAWWVLPARIGRLSP